MLHCADGRDPAQLCVHRDLLPATEQANKGKDESHAACKPESALAAGCQPANVESVPVVPSADTTSTAEVDHKSKHIAASKSKKAAGSNTPVVKRRIVKVARGGVEKLPGKAVFEKAGLPLFTRHHVGYH